ncbi:hypothetical protein [Sedimentibacter sp. LTW-03]|uniref:hypothetical protein n=1 Tax=Sedimentibacter sp. LTW-03 TaxID=3453406 RepID=UPI003F875BE4
MIDRMFTIIVVIIIAISVVSINARLEIIQSKLESDILNVRILERAQVLEELDFSYKDILKNVSDKYRITNDELKDLLMEGVE